MTGVHQGPSVCGRTIPRVALNATASTVASSAHRPLMCGAQYVCQSVHCLHCPVLVCVCVCVCVRARVCACALDLVKSIFCALFVLFSVCACVCVCVCARACALDLVKSIFRGVGGGRTLKNQEIKTNNNKRRRTKN